MSELKVGDTTVLPHGIESVVLSTVSADGVTTFETTLATNAVRDGYMVSVRRPE